MKQKLFTLTLLFVLPPLTLWLLFSAQPVPASQTSTIVYVNQAVVGGNNNGTSWADAYSDLQTALAASPPDSDNELWVAAGLYKPTGDTNREATFPLKRGVALYGGFAGTETERDQRDWTVNLTVLSGDIDNNDITTPAGVVTDTANIVGNNSYHVMTGSGWMNTAAIDGFILTAGKANGDYCSRCKQQCGGGLFNDNGSLSLTNVTFSGNSATNAGGGMSNDYDNNDSGASLTNVTFSGNSADIGGGMYNFAGSPSLTNVTFSGNSANYKGGGMGNWGSSPSLTNVTFSGNSADWDGGGMSNSYGSSSLTNVTFSSNSALHGGGIHNWDSYTSLTNITFSGNSAAYGGGMDNEGASYPSLINVTFSGNSASLSGGGMVNGDGNPSLTNVTFSGNSGYYGGGMASYTGNPSLTNVTFSGNSADYGGGMYNHTGNPSLTNVTFSHNSATNEGGGIYIYSITGTVTVSNSIIANSLSGGDCAGATITSAGYNIDSDGSCNLTAVGDMPNTDPALDPLAFNGGYTLTHMPRADSPAIDAGDPLNCPATDQRGASRPYDGNGDGNAVCDIGSVEFLSPAPSYHLLYLPIASKP